MELTPEEEEIIRRYRRESSSSKKAILASLSAFKNWIKDTIKWVWEKIVEFAMHNVVDALFDYFRQKFF
jgi:hypothetical protein